MPDEVPLETPSPQEQGKFVEEEGSIQQGHGYRTQQHSAGSDIPSANWIAGGWNMYAENWVPYTAFSLFFIVTSFSSFLLNKYTEYSVGTIIWFLSYPLHFGWFIAGSRVLKEKERLLREGDITTKVAPRLGDFFRGYYLFFPLSGYLIIKSIIIPLGFLFCIVPGFYLAVALSFVELVYIEYHRQGSFTEMDPGVSVPLGFFMCIEHSFHVIHQHCCEVWTFFLMIFFILVLGSISVLGLVIAWPVAMLSFIPAFQALFQFQMGRLPADQCNCYC